MTLKEKLAVATIARSSVTYTHFPATPLFRRVGTTPCVEGYSTNSEEFDD